MRKVEEQSWLDEAGAQRQQRQLERQVEALEEQIEALTDQCDGLKDEVRRKHDTLHAVDEMSSPWMIALQVSCPPPAPARTHARICRPAAAAATASLCAADAAAI